MPPPWVVVVVLAAVGGFVAVVWWIISIGLAHEEAALREPRVSKKVHKDK